MKNRASGVSLPAGNNKLFFMSRRDDITGAKALNGYRSSKANNKTKHRFHLNLQKKRFYIPEEDRWITLKVTSKTLRTINKNGISSVLKKYGKQNLIKQGK